MTKKQIPRGDENLKCPLWKKPMDQVCHTCPWWVHIRGMDRNTGGEVDHWNCSIAFFPMLQIETSHQGRVAAAATESFRNEMVSIAMNGPPAVDRHAAIAHQAPAHPMLPNLSGSANSVGD